MLRCSVVIYIAMSLWPFSVEVCMRFCIYNVLARTKYVLLRVLLPELTGNYIFAMNSVFAMEQYGTQEKRTGQLLTSCCLDFGPHIVCVS